MEEALGEIGKDLWVMVEDPDGIVGDLGGVAEVLEMEAN